MELKDIQNLIKFVAKSGASEVKLETDDIKITIKTGTENETTFVQQIPVAQQLAQPVAAAPTPVAPATPATAEPAAPAADDNSKYITVKSRG